jgi:hypothetical protein
MKSLQALKLIPHKEHPENFTFLSDVLSNLASFIEQLLKAQSVKELPFIEQFDSSQPSKMQLSNSHPAIFPACMLSFVNVSPTWFSFIMAFISFSSMNFIISKVKGKENNQDAVPDMETKARYSGLLLFISNKTGLSFKIIRRKNVILHIRVYNAFVGHKFGHAAVLRVCHHGIHGLIQALFLRSL